MRTYGFIAGGKERPSADGACFTSFSPITGEPWAVIAECKAKDVEDAVEAARSCHETAWGRLSATARGKFLVRFAETIASKAPYSMRFAKKHLNDAHLDYDARLGDEIEALWACMQTDDWREGVRAFAEKRAPVFRGR